MASITQTIPQYTSGLSEQPDHLKNPGQVSDALNVVPEVTTGLVKRPGSKYIKTLDSGDAPTDKEVTWFHYYRDQNEHYLGQITKSTEPRPTAYTPEIKMWDIKTGTPRSVEIATSRNYLRHYSDESLKFMTINDITYIINSNETVAMDTTSKSTTRPDRYAAFVELKKTANARQYSLNLYDTVVDDSGNVLAEGIQTATRIKAVKYTTPTAANIEDRVFPYHTPLPDEGSDANVDARPKMDTGSANTGTTGLTANIISLVNDPTCPDIGTQVFALNSYENNPQIKKVYGTGDMTNPLYDSSFGTSTQNGVSYTNNWKTDHGRGPGGAGFMPLNLVWRWTTKGVSGRRSDKLASENTVKKTDYHCTYDYDVELLFGGEGWYVGDKIEFTMPSRFAGAQDVTYQIEIEEIETAATHTTLTESVDTSKTGKDGDIRPSPTAFDAHTAITAGSILGGIEQKIDALSPPYGFSTTVIGSGIYISRTRAFNIETSENDLMNIMTDEVNDVGKLPTQCKHGYIVKIANSDADEDDYYMRFEGANGIDGNGAWRECASPGDDNSGIENAFDATTMPLQLLRKADGNFKLQAVDWGKREVGDENTNSIPSFVGNTINNAAYWRNRIVFLSSNNVITSQPGDDNVTSPTFWGKTALTVSPEDVIDLSASSSTPSKLTSALEVSAGLLLFSENQQFLMTSEAEILNPETAQVKVISTYNYNTNIAPFSLGTTAGFLDNAGSKSRFFEMTNIQRGFEPDIIEQSVVIPSLLPKDLDLVTNSRENNYIFFAKQNTDEVLGYRYFNSGEKRIQSAWFKWKLHKTIKYQCVIDDKFYVVLANNNLVAFDLRSADSTANIDVTIDSFNPNGVDYHIHLDNHTEIPKEEFTYVPSLNHTIVNVGSYGLDGDKKVAVIDDTPNDSQYSDFGRYIEVDVVNNTATLPGDWSYHDLYVGYNFDMQVKFPTIYPSSTKGTGTFSDINASLLIHRLKLSLGEVGVYETTIKRKGYDDYTELFESSIPDLFSSNTSPWLNQKIHTIPTYARNTILSVYLKSTHPSPATLYSMSWEGDYSTKFYQRA